MSEWTTLFAVAAGLYVIECCVWTKSTRTVLYRHCWRRVWRAARGADLPGNFRGGIALVDPIRWSGAVATAGEWPFAISPKGLTNVAPAAGGGSVSRVCYVKFEEIRHVDTQPGEIRINGHTFARVSSSVLAHHLAKEIQSLCRQRAPRRAPAIRAAVAATLNENAVATAWSTVQQHGARLAPLSAVLFLWVFVASPVLVFTLGPLRVWPILLAALLGLTGAIAVSYFRAHRRLFPELSYDRWTNAVSMAVLPLSAMRGADKLTRDALSLYSGLVVAPHLCGGMASLAYLRAESMDFECSGDPPAAAGDAAECIRWFRELLMAESEAALKRLHLDPFQAPLREDDCVSYCPRCHSQYLPGDARSCSVCPDVHLVRFEDLAPDAEKGKSSLHA
jgi:hypothetical protein